MKMGVLTHLLCCESISIVQVVTVHLKLCDLEDDTASSPSLNPSQKQNFASCRLITLHLSFLEMGT